MRGDATMNVVTLYAYFVAPICEPGIVLPSECLPQILADDSSRAYVRCRFARSPRKTSES